MKDIKRNPQRHQGIIESVITIIHLLRPFLPPSLCPNDTWRKAVRRDERKSPAHPQLLVYCLINLLVVNNKRLIRLFFHIMISIFSLTHSCVFHPVCLHDSISLFILVSFYLTLSLLCNCLYALAQWFPTFL